MSEQSFVELRHIRKVFNTSPYTDPGAPRTGSFRRVAQADGIERLSSYHRLPERCNSLSENPEWNGSAFQASNARCQAS